MAAARTNWSDFRGGTYHTQDQEYFLGRAQTNNQGLHVAGIVGDGLAVTAKKGSGQITVQPGYAIAGNGQLIYLAEAKTVKLRSGDAGKKILAVICYHAVPVDPPSSDTLGTIVDTAEVTFVGPSVKNPKYVPLAKLTLDAKAKIAAADLKVRAAAGAVLQPDVTLRNLVVTETTKLEGGATITGGKVGVGTTIPNAVLEVSGGAENTGLRVSAAPGGEGSGRVEVGYNVKKNVGRIQVWDGKGSQAASLLVQNDGGNLDVGKNPLRISSESTGLPDRIPNGAEICNDTRKSKSLMIVGNRSKDGKTRQVSIWDQLEVNGNQTVKGTLTVTKETTLQKGLNVPSGQVNFGGELRVNSNLRLQPGTTVNVDYGAGWHNANRKFITFATNYSGDKHRGQVHFYAPSNYYTNVPALTLAGAYGAGGYVGIGTTTPSGHLEVCGGAENSTLRVSAGPGGELSGRVEVGYNGKSNYGRLQAWDGKGKKPANLVVQNNGGTVDVGTNPIRLSDGWTDSPGKGKNRAEISNDIGTYKCLMLVGNKAKDGKTRKVAVWDRLEVNGNQSITGNLTVGGVTIGAKELGVLKKLAAGNLVVDLFNQRQKEYMYAADFAPFDNDRRRVFTWRKKTRINQGQWQLKFPT